jgi:hypothetical protein
MICNSCGRSILCRNLPWRGPNPEGRVSLDEGAATCCEDRSRSPTRLRRGCAVVCGRRVLAWAASARTAPSQSGEGPCADRVTAEIAEALAVTTYTNIIDAAPFFSHLSADDQGYLVAARQEEMSHYLLEQSATDEPSPFTSFFYPKGMFQDAQTTLNERPGYARRRVYCRLSGRRAQFQYARSARYRGAHHGHRKRPSHARACPGF